MNVQKMTNEQRQEFKKLANERFQQNIAEFKSSVKETTFKFFERLPERYKKGWLDAFNGKASKRKAIAMKCYECAAFEDVTNNVGGCTAITCSLWKYRPLQKKSK